MGVVPSDSYIKELDGTGQVNFETDPHTQSPGPEMSKNTYTFKSSPSWDNNGKLIPPRTSIADPGCSEYGAGLRVSGDKMSRENYLIVNEKFKSGRQQLYFDHLANTIYTVIIDKFENDYTPNTINIQYNLLMKIV